MTKSLSSEALVALYNKLNVLSPRDAKRHVIVTEAAEFYGVSTSTIYRQLRKYNKLSIDHRADYNKSRIINLNKMRYYCEIIAALKYRTTKKKTRFSKIERSLSTKECIRLLETCGVETQSGLIKAPVGLLKKTTINLYLKNFHLDKASMNIQPSFVRFQAEHSNDLWQFDFSRSDFQGFSKEQHPENDPVLMLASVVDDRSGVMYQEYHYVYGEDTMTALKFFFNAMSAKKKPGFPFQGIPKAIYMDNGPVAKSKVFRQVMLYLHVEIITHMPDGSDGKRKTARAKGKVERSFRSVKDSLESMYNFHQPKDLAEANKWLSHYLEGYNQAKHRREDHSRLEDWKLNLPKEGFRAMCDWDKFSTLAREPEVRKVGNDACVNINGVKYQVSNELAGLSVTLLWGIFDNELRVEHNGNHYGPFYPTSDPIQFGKYRSFKKNSREKYAEKIESLANVISIPRSALSNDNNNDNAKIIELVKTVEDNPPSVAFVDSVFEQNFYKNVIEAKTAIANWLGFPLGRLMPEQIARINEIVAETLDKKMVMSKIKQMFSIKLIETSGAKQWK